ncbi:thiamine/molybdopterin biosynthesis protein MoeB [Paenibacillus baekrokdamisoli]|uniref:Thiamine/molybdopterin biosynthesis protein MoeB n=1 Tax=Paenibacillus baekrokdamisoli TaxID=1712516 RepID=A0A3G9JEY5_9BACL|nr:ThiF family adenylyltransferase [Paenibacillus baekrokdamisoli]MBB3071101.1 adenylyltransferase/sulfurtransferase [Paenibacillus baekrokdamisoli]BBH21519.1 thiamine/molybdopterin biosynthesis protein MoeB [Paenibacillus baekrokdamisoli]
MTDRYSRQSRFAPIGQEGQRLLSNSRAVVVGMGALGSVAAQHLVRSGVGYVRIIDRDILELSNLQRQVLYNEEDVHRLLPKAEAAAGHLRSINSEVIISPVITDLTAYNAESLLGDVDLIIDGSDNFTVRYLLNDISQKLAIPWIYGGVVGASGMTMTFLPGQTPCFSCLFPNEPPAGSVDTCETAGVLSTAVDIIASIQATEALKWLSGNRDELHGTLFQVDLWHHRFMPLNVSGSRRTDCPSCQLRQFTRLDHNASEPTAAALCGRNTIQITHGRSAFVDLEVLAKRLARVGTIERNPFLLRYRRDETFTAVLFSDGRALIQGTEDPIIAKRIYSEIYGL